MTDNRSLEEFLGADTSGEGAEPDPEPAAGEDAPEPAPEPGEPATDAEPTADGEAARDAGPDEPVEPMAETVVWSSAGGECARCGAAVEERWRDGDALVCGDCKAW